MTDIRNNWTYEEVKEIYHLPLLDLINRASNIHRKYHDSTKMNMNTLVSVRTGVARKIVNTALNRLDTTPM